MTDNISAVLFMSAVIAGGLGLIALQVAVVVWILRFMGVPI